MAERSDVRAMAERLLQYGIHKGFVQARTMLATQLVSDDCPPECIDALMREASEQKRDNPAGWVKTLLENGNWREYWAELGKDLKRQQWQEKEDRERARGTASSLRFVTESNPYGWANPDMMRGQDYGEPGAWNAFRQCYNGKMRQRPNGSYDARRFGCSRFEVCGGVGGRRQPKDEWDPDEVVQAKRFGEGSEPIDVKQKREAQQAEDALVEGVYGDEEQRDPLEDL